MKKFARLFTLSTILAISACSNVEVTNTTIKQLRNPESISTDYNYLETRENDYLKFKNKIRLFSSRLSDSFVKREFSEAENITISPLSIELCLGLAIRSASGETRDELLRAIDIDYSSFNKYYNLFYRELNKEIFNDYKQLECQLLLTNSIWIDNDVSLLENGLDALRDDYYCYSYEADFDKNNKETNKAIKDFINEKTKGLLNPSLDIPKTTLFLLMNTLYLKDIWNDAGEDLSLADSSYKFTNYDKSTSLKRLLLGNYISGKRFSNDLFSSFLTTTRHGYQLYFIKPNEGQNIKSILNSDNFNAVLEKANYVTISEAKKEKYYTRCIFPIFKAEVDMDLIEMFNEDFGVQTLFNNRCDFSNLSETKVYCSNFKHIAKLDVSRKGIEGAAVTYMAMAGSAAPDETYKDVYEDFVVDKEFGFVLTNYYNDVLFSGVVTNID